MRGRGRLAGSLFDLLFFEVDVLPRHGIVLLEDELLGLIPRILLGNVIKARTGAAHELDLLGDGFSHGILSAILKLEREPTR